MTSVLPLQCFSCARLDRSLGDIPLTGLPRVERCQAFPNGIPDVMKEGGDHRQPIGGEVDGLLFKLSSVKEQAEFFPYWERVFGPDAGSSSGG